MGCCDADSVQVSKMALEIKSGPMLWHKRRFFGSNWRDVHSVLYNDSSLLWYKDKSRQEQDGGVILKEAPELIAYGPYTSQVPDRPPLPDNYEPKEFMAFGVRGKDVVFWFLCPNEEEVASWMAAIVTTLPPPPMPPQAQQSLPAPPSPMGGYPNQQQQSAPPQPPQYTPIQQQPQYAPIQQQPAYVPQAAAIPGQYPPPTNYRPPPQIGNNSIHPQAYPTAAAGGGGPTTVIVNQDRPGYSGVVGGGAGDFAMGMVLGGAIGTAWGSHHHFGFGGGWGGGGGWGRGPTNNDTNININNYYDNDTTTVNNNMELTNNTSVEQVADPQAQIMPPISSDPMPQFRMQEDYASMPVEYLPVEESTDYNPVENSTYPIFESYGDYGGCDFGGDDFGGDF